MNLRSWIYDSIRHHLHKEKRRLRAVSNASTERSAVFIVPIMIRLDGTPNWFTVWQLVKLVYSPIFYQLNKSYKLPKYLGNICTIYFINKSKILVHFETLFFGFQHYLLMQIEGLHNQQG